jgi:hypothetical protein
MPGVYKKKNCPSCGVEHRKQGKYCGQSCAAKVSNAQREVTEETKEKIKQKVNEYHQTPEGLATAAMVTRQNEQRAVINQKIRDGDYILAPEDYWIDIPNFEEDDGFRL